MKKNIYIIVCIVAFSILFSILLLKGSIIIPNIYKTLKQNADTVLEEMKEKKQIVKNQKKGYIVLKDGSIWYKIKEENNILTLISAYPLNEDGLLDENPYLISFHKNCFENCNISEKESELIPFISKKFLEPLINKLGKKESEGIITRYVTLEDLKILGCDIDNLDCTSAPSWLSEFPIWTSSTIEGSNKVFILDTDKKIKEYEANKKAYLRVVLITDKKNVY